MDILKNIESKLNLRVNHIGFRLESVVNKPNRKDVFLSVDTGASNITSVYIGFVEKDYFQAEASDFISNDFLMFVERQFADLWELSKEEYRFSLEKRWEFIQEKINSRLFN